MSSMVQRIVNLPWRDSDGELVLEIEGVVIKRPSGFSIKLKRGDGWIITDNIDFNKDNEQDVADTIARIVELAMDAGFEQGREHIRKAMGLER